MNPHASPTPSAWVNRFAPLVRAGGVVLDVASGHGRHAKLFAERGHPCVAIDIDALALQSISATHPQVQCVVADIEGKPWPLLDAAGQPQRFDAVVVTHYLWRPLMPTLMASLAPGGVLIYETFAVGNETVGKPSRPDFLLRNAELLNLCQHLRVVAFEDGFSDTPPRFIQRVCAVKEVPGMPAQRYPL